MASSSSAAPSLLEWSASLSSALQRIPWCALPGHAFLYKLHHDASSHELCLLLQPLAPAPALFEGLSRSSALRRAERQSGVIEEVEMREAWRKDVQRLKVALQEGEVQCEAARTDATLRISHAEGGETFRFSFMLDALSSRDANDAWRVHFLAPLLRLEADSETQQLQAAVLRLQHGIEGDASSFSTRRKERRSEAPRTGEASSSRMTLQRPRASRLPHNASDDSFEDPSPTPPPAAASSAVPSPLPYASLLPPSLAARAADPDPSAPLPVPLLPPPKVKPRLRAPRKRGASADEFEEMSETESSATESSEGEAAPAALKRSASTSAEPQEGEASPAKLRRLESRDASLLGLPSPSPPSPSSRRSSLASPSGADAPSSARAPPPSPPPPGPSAPPSQSPAKRTEGHSQAVPGQAATRGGRGTGYRRGAGKRRAF
ncbi:hypothetical protein FA09DRAFT_329612 [Tilletiopsis washingtonensis]|uniref:Uncharacterized protein n=1 Tax=Tilletiopsis washingtonensis TaxID=58919 RepID=A0A316ZBZ1_9BASI|nr:hypothetical protein FA09DRAFT_329612 [Tilletiopsis washingtonensis]PWN98558.1 hypothetical protein FA09DRAFT_329612 [Tilletiopsis washingtonensis]